MIIISRNVPVAALAVSLVVAATACDSSSEVSAEKAQLRVGSAFAPLSLPLAEEYKERLPGIEVSIVRALHSKAVIEGIEDGSIDLGVVFADEAYSAYWSHDPSGGDSAVRGVVLLQPLPQYLLVAGGSGIRSVADLDGRTLVVGLKTTSSYVFGPIILEAFGVTAEVRSVATRSEAAQLLLSGEADATLLPGYTYPDEVLHPAIQAGAYFVPIDGPPIDRLRMDRPFIRRTMIPRDVYPGQDQLIPTIGIDLVVVCREGLPDRMVYDLTAALMNAYPQLSGIEANLRFLNPDEAPATPIPLHPGSARYFRERELSR